MSVVALSSMFSDLKKKKTLSKMLRCLHPLTQFLLETHASLQGWSCVSAEVTFILTCLEQSSSVVSTVCFQNHPAEVSFTLVISQESGSLQSNTLNTPRTLESDLKARSRATEAWGTQKASSRLILTRCKSSGGHILTAAGPQLPPPRPGHRQGSQVLERFH